MPSRQQLKQLQNALINAFPSKSSLERLLYFELEKNLNEITRESDLQEIVFKLIQTAESQGWLEDLVYAARKENPGNPLLQAIAQESIQSWFAHLEHGDTWQLRQQIFASLAWLRG